MHLYSYENEKLNKIKYDAVRDFCLCEKVDEEYTRSLIKRDCCGVRGIIMKMGGEQVDWRKVILNIL